MSVIVITTLTRIYLAEKQKGLKRFIMPKKTLWKFYIPCVLKSLGDAYKYLYQSYELAGKTDKRI